MPGLLDIRYLIDLSVSYHDAVKIFTRHTQVHDMITADSTVVDDNVPCPESYRVPLNDVSIRLVVYCLCSCAAHLLDLEALLVAFSTGTSLGCLGLGRGCICHINVRHGCIR